MRNLLKNRPARPQPIETQLSPSSRESRSGVKSIEFKGNSYPTRGAKGFVEMGGTQRRTTATRLVVGSVITFGVGTAIGAMAKKKTNNIYLTIEFESGMAILIEAKAKQEGDARRFAQAVTTAGVQADNP